MQDETKNMIAAMLLSMVVLFAWFFFFPPEEPVPAESQVAERAREIYLHAGVTNAMPPANVSFMEPAERRLIQAWYRGVTSGKAETK